MASIRAYQDGAGGSSGADLAQLKPVYTSGTIYYLGNATTGNSDSNSGKERVAPLSTLAQANTNMSAGDALVILASHSETLASAVTLSNNGLTIVGEGSGTTIPRFTNNVAATMINWTGTGIMMDNIYFPASTSASQVRMTISGARFEVRNLKVDCGANDTATGSVTTAGAVTGRFFSCAFTATGATPTPALTIAAASSPTDITMDTVTFDAGSFTWNANALLVGAGATVTRLRATKLSLLNGSHVSVPTGTTGYIQVSTVTGDSRIDWTP